MAETKTSSALATVRWKRYGHDRLYVNTSDGRRVGWVDMKTGDTTVELEDLRDAFEAATREHLAGDDVPVETTESPTERTESAQSPTPETADSPPPPPPPPPPAVEQPWTDLALNRPGEAVSSEARKAFADAPVRSIAARVLKVHTDERAWRIGAKGEALVGKQLAKLGPEWRALHSVPIGDRGSDIDHVVLGPGGAYTINAKNHPHKEIRVHGNSFFVNGTRVHYVRNARYEADRAPHAHRSGGLPGAGDRADRGGRRSRGVHGQATAEGWSSRRARTTGRGGLAQPTRNRAVSRPTGLDLRSRPTIDDLEMSRHLVV